MSESSKVFESAVKGFLQPIWSLLQDEQITEVMINSFDEIWVEIKGKVERADTSFSDEDSLLAAVRSIAQSVGRRIDAENPTLDARLPNGYRIHAVIPPCARKGTTLAIRKFSSHQFTFEDYIRFGSLTGTVSEFLKVCVALGKNILVSGGTGSGKTSLLGSFCSYIPKGQRIIVIEDSSELIVDYEHTVFFETRMPDSEGKGAVSIQDLLKSSLRLRPDRIIVGEVRGGEALQLINAMNTGHKGCLGTIHANTPQDAIVRLEVLAQGASSQLSERALQLQIASAIDIIVQTSRFADGSRKISSVAEVLGVKDGIYDVKPLFEVSHLGKKVKNRLQATGIIPSFVKEIENSDVSFPTEAFAVKTAA